MLGENGRTKRQSERFDLSLFVIYFSQPLLFFHQTRWRGSTYISNTGLCGKSLFCCILVMFTESNVSFFVSLSLSLSLSLFFNPFSPSPPQMKMKWAKSSCPSTTSPSPQTQEPNQRKGPFFLPQEITLLLVYPSQRLFSGVPLIPKNVSNLSIYKVLVLGEGEEEGVGGEEDVFVLVFRLLLRRCITHLPHGEPFLPLPPPLSPLSLLPLPKGLSLALQPFPLLQPLLLLPASHGLLFSLSPTLPSFFSPPRGEKKKGIVGIFVPKGGITSLFSGLRGE